MKTRTEKTTRKDKTGKHGAFPFRRNVNGPMIIFYLVSLICYLVTCEQPSGPRAYGPVETVPHTPLPSTPENATGIAILSPPDTTYYAKGQPFDRTGLAVGWLLDDGTTGDVLSEDRYTLEEPDMGKPGPKRVYIRAGDYPSVSFNILVSSSDSVLASVTVSGPAKNTQELGKEFSKTGLAVTGQFSDGTTQNLASVAAIVGYDKSKRGPQTVTVKVNQFTQPLEGVTTRIGAGARVRVNNLALFGGVDNVQLENYKSTYIKGEPFNPVKSNIKLFVSPSDDPYMRDKIALSLENGGLTGADFDTFTGFDPATPGKQTPTIAVDGRTLEFDFFVINVEPAVWFDYGYMRHAGDTGGHGPGAGVYYAKPNETLVIAPVRYLVGYNADNTNAGASYNWTVSGGAETHSTSQGGELLHITPKAAGEYTINVSVTGKSFVGGAGFTAGANITRTATTKLICYNNAGDQNILAAGPYTSPLKNFGAGQMCEGGTGFGWSLGCVGGYEVWTVNHQPSYKIEGNPFGTWHEAGVVWMQEDRNGNGIPDETWYELRGGDDDDGTWQNYIMRRYAITYVNGSVRTSPYDNRVVYWADAKGRSNRVPGGFPYLWGVAGNDVIGDWVTYTGTLLRDDGNIATAKYGGLGPMTGYVDTIDEVFYVNKAMDLAGNPVNLTSVKFIRVQTSVFRYGGIFGDVSTEIQYADFLGTQSLFDKPE